MMPTLIVKAKKLNKRSRIPANFPDLTTITGVVKEGYVFEGREVPAEETPNPGLGTWYVDRDGFFYWGGGVNTATRVTARELPAETRGFTFDPAKMSWAHRELMITDIWNDAQVAGRNVRVAILEEGFEMNHSDLKPVLSEIFFAGEGRKEHGTEMAGIIGGKGNKVFGIAPECEMLFAKVDFNNTGSIVSGLQWARRNGADIISMSFMCDLHDDIERELKSCFDTNIALIAAAGDAGELNEPVDIYPASSPNCFAIGCFGRDFQRMNISSLTNNLKLLAPGQSIRTSRTGDRAEEIDGQTSLATAFTSGAIALLLSVARKSGRNFTARQITDILCVNADKRNNEGDNHNDRYGFGLIFPINVFPLIK